MRRLRRLLLYPVYGSLAVLSSRRCHSSAHQPSAPRPRHPERQRRLPPGAVPPCATRDAPQRGRHRRCRRWFDDADVAAARIEVQPELQRRGTDAVDAIEHDAVAARELRARPVPAAGWDMTNATRETDTDGRPLDYIGIDMTRARFEWGTHADPANGLPLCLGRPGAERRAGEAPRLLGSRRADGGGHPRRTRWRACL